MIEIEYIVKDSRGFERLRTADKKAADAYDRILENAERLAQWLRADQVLPNLPEPDLENLTIYLARHAREVEQMLKGKPVERAPGAGLESEPESAPESLPEKVAPLKSVRG